MKVVHLEAAADHVERLARENEPTRALIEIIWNGLDAEATRVDVVYTRNTLGGITRIQVEDDGHGMHPSEATAVEAWGRQEGAISRLDSGATFNRVTTALAPYLLSFPDISVSVDGREINPVDAFEVDATRPVEFISRRRPTKPRSE